MKTKLLLIDDELELLENLRELLLITGYEVDTATSGNGGIQLLQQTSYDLIISDLMMPDGDGYAVLDYVRSKEELINTPFIFLTAKLEKESQRRGIEKGAEDYLLKPITVESLDRAIKASLDKKAKFEEFVSKRVNEAVKQERNVKYHEIRSPLFAMLSSLEFLKDNISTLSSEEVDGFLTETHSAAMRMNESFVKLQKWLDLPDKSPEPRLHQSLNQLIESKKEDTDQISIESAEEVLVYFEERILEYVLEELLSNARKFNSGDEGIRIILRPDSLIIHNRQDYLDQSGIYEPKPFHQISREKYEQQGLGLGLYLAKTYSDRNDYDLKCYVDETSFQVSLSSKKK